MTASIPRLVGSPGRNSGPGHPLRRVIMDRPRVIGSERSQQWRADSTGVHA